ncbi:MAG: hypothetical protein IPP57_20170 [Candidatus Obscuribacter sp.]|jgi:uncharacterized membrane protein YebE (DUF533 family)|nr:hypothetical protein [Candidatus Obscuribacter sp.]MBK7836528.1 hypothetical protein [Candidatus Obscuribacter sp.]MBK9205574.1 hypothetical protein [Candidatus Obscuribacter sp.]MBK9617645.1 hypothetical protein [Candidatus Obscuribacter sp.]MBK9773098.1 hypothetical protein [Candidatus Obscuribacter sp.]
MARTLEDALKEVLADDNKINRYEARVIREMIMADGVVSEDEKALLEKALTTNDFDSDAFDILSNVLLRSHMKD